MEKDEDNPFPRESWRRLLQDRDEQPPEMTDARIRAAARKVVVPRTARWWLPASLAASFLLAVLVVQWQYGRDEKPAIVTEGDLAAPATPHSPADAATPRVEPRLSKESATLERNESSATVSNRERADDEFAPEPAAAADDAQAAGSAASVGGPEQELRASSEFETEAADEPASPEESSAIAAQAPVAEAARAAPASAAVTQKSRAKVRTPEVWYAEIEALRKAGRVAEADAELAQFEATYPDWLKQHDKPRP